jgi:hypothetical protein
MATGTPKLSARAQALIDAARGKEQQQMIAEANQRLADPVGGQLAALVRESHAATDGKVTAPPATVVSPVPATSTSIAAAPAPLLPASTTLSLRAGYTPKAMVDLMADHPEYSHGQLCAHFGRPSSWLASVLASSAFQAALDERRHEIADPTLTASLHERFKALAIRTSNVMMTKMDSPEVADFMVLKAGEIAIKALGMGQKHAEAQGAPAAPAVQQESLAERLMKMMDERDGKRTVDVDAEEVTPNGNI